MVSGDEQCSLCLCCKPWCHEPNDHQWLGYIRSTGVHIPVWFHLKKKPKSSKKVTVKQRRIMHNEGTVARTEHSIIFKVLSWVKIWKRVVKTMTFFFFLIFFFLWFYVVFLFVFCFSAVKVKLFFSSWLNFVNIKSKNPKELKGN